MRILTLTALSLLFGAGAVAASGDKAKPKKSEQALPYLGPGAEKLSKEDYERVYKNYIQTSILLGYPFLQEKAQACDQALSSLFRTAGMFGYPVPAEAQQVTRAVKVVGAHKVETYELAGVLVQVARQPKTNALEQVLLVNSSSPKATRRLSGFAKRELLGLERDPVTGLERVHGIPVGYPHPFLTQDGQGLYVKLLKFNGKAEGCLPLDFQDNAWVGGYDLSTARCTELQEDAEKVWSEQLSPDDFAQRELTRMKKLALDSALGKGVKESEAKALVEKQFVLPLTNEINIVGSAMRNLAQCNLLALGKAGKPAAGVSSTRPDQSGTTAPSDAGSGTAK